MTKSRTGFWIAITLLLAIWLAALLLGGRDQPTDIAVYRMLYRPAGTALARDAIVFTELGSGFILPPLALIATIYVAMRRKRRAALLLIMTFGGRFLVELQKLII